MPLVGLWFWKETFPPPRSRFTKKIIKIRRIAIPERLRKMEIFHSQKNWNESQTESWFFPHENEKPAAENSYLSTLGKMTVREKIFESVREKLRLPVKNVKSACENEFATVKKIAASTKNGFHKHFFSRDQNTGLCWYSDILEGEWFAFLHAVNES